MRIGLIAMSGIKVYDEELLRLGLTLPGFVERGKAVASLPSLALLTLAGLTPKRHSVEYIEVPDLKELESIPDEFDLVGISSYSAQILDAYELATKYRDKGIPVVIGGPHVTCLPHEASRYCDAVAIGEGEPIWLDILDDVERGELKRFYGSPFSNFDMKDAPMPAFELLDPHKYNRLTVQTSRGCPHRCEFCAASILISDRYKQKPKNKVLAEIDKIKDIWKRPFIEFADDNTLVARSYWKELLPDLSKRQVRWFAETDISVAEDNELLKLMSNSGCAQVLIGLESPITEGLNGLELRSNWKLKTWWHHKKAIAKIQRHGIRVIGCFILGLDGHGPHVADELFAFVNELGLFDVQVTIQTAFPGTPLYDRLKKADRIIEDENWRKCTLFDVNFQPTAMTANELTECFKELVIKLYSDEQTNWRRNNFKQNLKIARKAS